MAAGEDLLALIDREIPEGRTSLQENYMNLENVAKYCEDNYQRANVNEKSDALMETRNYTTHSLASVAYQINNLATNFLKLLDLQQSQLTDMESSVNHLNQIVMIHKEKVARREIGVLTSSRNVPRPLGMKNGIIYPEQTERPIKYTRKQIDYAILDDIGHGVRAQNQQATTPRTARSPSVSSTHSNMSNNTAGSNHQQQAPTSKPPTPPVIYKAGNMGQGSGTIGRAGGGHYRALGPPVAPPVAPSTPPISTPPQFQHQPGNNSNQNSSNNYPPQAYPSSQPTSTRTSVSSSSTGGGGGVGSYSPSNTLVMGSVHSPPILGGGMGMPGGPITMDGYNFGPPSHHPQHHPHPLASPAAAAGASHNVAAPPSRHPAPPPLMPMPHHPPHLHSQPLPQQQQYDPAMAYSRNSSAPSNKGLQGWIDPSLPPPPPEEGFDAEAILASPPLPPPPSSDIPDQFDYNPAPPPPPDFSDEREGPPSMRDGVAQPLENDIYGTAQGVGDDPYAATGPQFLAPQTSWIPKHYLEKVVAIYDYQANKGDELSFAENAIIYVIHKNDDGWWEGVMDGKTGLFPYNYVEPCM